MRRLAWVVGALLLAGLAWREWSSTRWMTADERDDVRPAKVAKAPTRDVEEPAAALEVLCHLCVLEDQPGYLAQYADEPGWSDFVAKNSDGAARGDADAQYQLGLAYLYGGGVQNDRAKAFELFAQAAAQKHPKASRWHASNLENIHAQKTGKVYGTKESRGFHEVAAQGGVTASMSMLAAYYEYVQNYTEAARYHRLAIDAGAVCAKYSLACLYLDGNGVTKDVARAIQLMSEDTECANTGHDLADIYTTGKHHDKDYAAAVKVLKRIGLPGHLARAAELYEKGGFGLTKNLAEAFKLFEAAKEGGGAVDTDIERVRRLMTK